MTDTQWQAAQRAAGKWQCSDPACGLWWPATVPTCRECEAYERERQTKRQPKPRAVTHAEPRQRELFG
jgi:hypothetical protein